MTFSEIISLLTKIGPTVLSDVASFESGQPVTVNASENSVVISGVGTLKVSESVTIQKVA